MDQIYSFSQDVPCIGSLPADFVESEIHESQFDGIPNSDAEPSSKDVKQYINKKTSKCTNFLNWTTLLDISLFKKETDEYKFVISEAYEDKRYLLLQIRQLRAGKPANFGVTFNPENFEFLLLKLEGKFVDDEYMRIEFKKKYVIFHHKHKKSFYLPNEALDELKKYMPVLNDIARYQIRDDPKIAMYILQFVYSKIFGGKFIAFNDTKLFRVSQAIGKYFNISGEKFQEISKDYTEPNFIANISTLEDTLIFIVRFNNCFVNLYL